MKNIIDFTMGELTTAFDGEVMKAVQRVGINVNKEELIQALELNRKIVRCKECKHGEYREEYSEYECHASGCGLVHVADFYCADAERKGE